MGGLAADTSPLSIPFATFGFARMGGLAGLFSLPVLRLGKGHRYAGAIGLDVQNRNARSGHHG